MKKRFWIFLAGMLLLAGAGLFWAFYQHRPAINDGTSAENRREEGSVETEGGQGDGEDSLVISPLVKQFTGEEQIQILGAIRSVTMTEGMCRMTFQGTLPEPFLSLGSGDVFFLDGQEDSPLNGPYFGKIVTADRGEDELTLLTETPAADEVFDELRMNFSETLDVGQLQEIRTAEGVTVERIASLDEIDMETSYSQALHAPAAEKNTAFLSDGEKNALLFKINLEKKRSEEESILFRGEIGLDEISLHGCLDMGIQYPGFVHNLWFGADADFVSNVSFEGKSKLLSLDESKEKEGFLKGLDPKKFEIAYLDFLTGKKIAGMPVSVGVLVFMDLDGEVTFEYGLDFKFRKELNSGDIVLVRDGKFQLSWEEDKKDALDDLPDLEWRAFAKLSGDLDWEILGASAMLYVCNVNLLELNLATIGMEAEGKIEAEFSSQTGPDLSSDWYGRLYLKLLGLHMKLSAKVKLFSVELGGELKFDYTLFDKTLMECGKKKESKYREGEMAVQQLTAYDKDYVYYKDLNGHLVKTAKDGSGRETLDYGEFFTICGIDESYLYLMKHTGDQGLFDVYRVNKESGDKRRVAESVSWVLYQDAEDMYYVPSGQKNTIMRLDRQTLKEEKFAELEEDVELMTYQKNKESFLVTTAEGGVMAFFGPSNHYYRVSKQGEVTALGDRLEIEEMESQQIGSYQYLRESASNGYLRATAKEVYILPDQSDTPVKIDTVAGWNPTETGVFAAENADGDGLPYEVKCYLASSGKAVTAVRTESPQSIFTFVQDPLKNWYYFDQTDEALILYRLDEDFSGKTEIERFDRTEIRYSLDDCAMTMIGNVLYFYTISDGGETSSMLYRYSVY